MLGDHDAHAGVGQRAQPRGERDRRLRVELRHRLVQQQQRGPAGERGGQGDALQLAAGELARRPGAQVAGTCLAECLVDPGPDLGRGPGGALERERDLAVDGEHDRAGLGILEDDARPRADLGRARVTRVESGHAAAAAETAAVEVRDEPAERPQQRRLARAARAREQHELAFGELEIDAGERVALGPGRPVANAAQLGEHRSTTISAAPSRPAETSATSSAPAPLALPRVG